MQQKEDLYQTLRLSKNAGADEVKKAFKKLAIENHPDKNPGDASKEDTFKKINQAYSILSDPQKREMYDRFGITEEGGGGGGGPADIGEMFQGMFGGGMPGMHGMHQMPGGFSFVFGGGGPPQGNPFDDILGQMFGGGHGGHDTHQSIEQIDVPISLAEVYNGTNKKVEFELLDMCNKCQGTGAHDPSQILKCITCKGEGRVQIQINPFMVSMSTCDSCGGTGSIIKNNKVCQHCKGKKTHYIKKTFEFNIPKGIPNDHQVRMNGKGSWNEKTKQHGIMIFKMVYDVKAPFSVNGLDVHLKLDISIEDLLCGFEKDIQLYGENIKIFSTQYFNPTNPLVIAGRGLPASKKTPGNLIINFNIIFDDNTRLPKYNDVFQKILKKKAIEVPEKIGANILLTPP